jgi:hypothetical protein
MRGRLARPVLRGPRRGDAPGLPAQAFDALVVDPRRDHLHRAGTKITRGPGSRAAGLAIAFKLMEAAQDRWRAVNAPHLVALVRAGARFEARQARRTT